MIDSHAHVTFDSFDDDRAEVIERAQQAGIGWIEIGTSVAESEQAVGLASQYGGVWASVGVHPSDIAELNEAAWEKLARLLNEPKAVAVGEVGLDYYRGGTKEVQLPVLERFVRLANEKALPVIFHVRDSDAKSAHTDLLEYLEELSKSDRPRGVIHTFSGTAADAERYLALGLYLSFSGVITFKNAGEITEIARTAPLDRILIETDSPFLTPEPHRGERNEPAYVRYVAEKIAELRGATVEEIDKVTTQNTGQLFDLQH